MANIDTIVSTAFNKEFTRQYQSQRAHMLDACSVDYGQGKTKQYDIFEKAGAPVANYSVTTVLTPKAGGYDKKTISVTPALDYFDIDEVEMIQTAENFGQYKREAIARVRNNINRQIDTRALTALNTVTQTTDAGLNDVAPTLQWVENINTHATEQYWEKTCVVMTPHAFNKLRQVNQIASADYAKVKNLDSGAKMFEFDGIKFFTFGLMADTSVLGLPASGHTRAFAFDKMNVRFFMNKKPVTKFREDVHANTWKAVAWVNAGFGQLQDNSVVSMRLND